MSWQGLLLPLHRLILSVLPCVGSLPSGVGTLPSRDEMDTFSRRKFSAPFVSGKCPASPTEAA